MNLSEYIKAERGRATKLAAELGIAQSALSQIIADSSAVNPARCVQIEELTGRQVRRWELRPTDWWLIWPELIGSAGAPRLSAVHMKART